MEKKTPLQTSFPMEGVELRCVLVVRDYARALAFYREVLGATVIHELAPTLCELRFAGSQILLVAPSNKPAATDPSPAPHTGAIFDFSIQVPDCLAAYHLLRARGAEFLTPPVVGRKKTLAFLLDPDGHLIELWETRGE
jgi:catechol 2,3-dioxygenase-like lactoylglutathione lyase family enzyme